MNEKKPGLPPVGPNDNMHVSPQGILLTQGYEKCRLVAYHSLPSEPWTIAYGNTFYEDGSKVKAGDTIIKQRADKLFRLIAPTFENIVRKFVTRPLLQREFDACFDFAYNTGGGYISKGKFVPYDLWANVNTHLVGEAMEAYWGKVAITSSGVPLAGLRRRRKSEVHMYLTGVLDFFEHEKF